jgi:hypothetical protein
LVSLYQVRQATLSLRARCRRIGGAAMEAGDY